MQERRGVEYLAAMGPLTAVLTQAQSASVAGGTIDAPGLAAAIAGVADADTRLGDDLRTHERWADLRGKIEALSAKRPAAGQAAYDAYGEVTDLLLALYGKVRENSQLIRDPDADGYYLQDGVAEELPEFLVATGRFTDLALIVSTLTPATSTGPGSTSTTGSTSGAGTGQGGGGDQQAIQLARLLSSQDSVSSPAEDLTDDLQAAVAVSESPTLGANLFNLLDRLRLTMDAVGSSAILDDGQISPADASALAALRATAIEAVNPLYASVLEELDTLIATRLGQVSVDRRLALSALVLAALIAFLPTLLLTVGRLRAGRGEQAPLGRHGRTEPDTAEPDAAGSRSFPAWSSSGLDGTGPRERERSGAAR